MFHPGIWRWLGAARGLGCILLVSAALAWAAGARAGQPLSVGDCVRLARLHAPEALIAGAARESARQDSLLHRFDQRPSYSLFGGATAAPRNFYDPVATNLGEYELKAGMEWPLRDGGMRARDRQRAALDAQGALLDQRLAARDAGLRAGELALASVRQAELARTQRESLEWLDRLAFEMAAGARAGTRGRADAQRAALERDDATSELESTARAGHALGRELARWLGLPPDSLPEVSPPEGRETQAPDAGDSLRVLAAFGGAPEIAQAQLDTQRARLELDLARRRRETQLALALDAGLWGTDLTSSVPEELRAQQPGATFADRLRHDLGASLALRFRLPLVDPGAPHDVAGRSAASEGAALRAQSAAAEARRAALELLDRWRDAVRRVSRAEASVGLAEENLLRLRSLHASGSAPLLELLDARRELDVTRVRLAEARFDARLARLEAEER
jgi:outer membrane protein TolC